MHEKSATLDENSHGSRILEVAAAAPDFVRWRVLNSTVGRGYRLERRVMITMTGRRSKCDPAGASTWIRQSIDDLSRVLLSIQLTR